eukprot:TRINITY_DN11512_c0_g1_i1.p1 TRINITY_DN11512_c0_g1~~TRINITY_DN11512_c0_g1_i1.p1  ORF type:complete len:283 (-),score=65.03 TRINITY_DN11512_c0_g1_i1:17-865(-)
MTVVREEDWKQLSVVDNEALLDKALSQLNTQPTTLDTRKSLKSKAGSTIKSNMKDEANPEQDTIRFSPNDRNMYNFFELTQDKVEEREDYLFLKEKLEKLYFTQLKPYFKKDYENMIKARTAKYTNDHCWHTKKRPPVVKKPVDFPLFLKELLIFEEKFYAEYAKFRNMVGIIYYMNTSKVGYDILGEKMPPPFVIEDAGTFRGATYAALNEKFDLHKCGYEILREFRDALPREQRESPEEKAAREAQEKRDAEVAERKETRKQARGALASMLKARKEEETE